MTHCCHSHDGTVVSRSVVVIRLPVCKKRLFSKDRITMWQVAAIYLVVLVSTTLADSQICNSNGPGNCTFASGPTSCNWTFHTRDAWTSEMNSTVYGTGSEGGDNMTSTTACSTEGVIHCLQIRYLFKENNITGLAVYVRDEDGDEKQVWCSARQGLNTWHTADIPICNDKDFHVILEARKYMPEAGRVLLNHIKYVNSSCSPEQTNGTPSSTSIALCTEKRTTTGCTHASNTTSPDQTISTTEDRTPTSGSQGPNAVSTDETVSTTDEPRTSGSHVFTDVFTDNSKAVSKEVDVAVGVVVAVIVIAVAVVIFILYRRKRLHLWKTCFRNENKNNTAASGTPQNGERTVGRDDRRTVNSVNSTPTVSGYENNPFTFSGPQSSVSYYNVIKDADGAGDSAAPQYSNMHGSQSAECSKEPNSSTFADIDPYEIKAENGNLPSAATRNPNPKTHPKGTTKQYQNYPVPACNRDKSQPTSDYSLARAEGGETNGVYDYPEEDPRNPGEGGETALYQYAKDPDVNGERHADATGVYHILERDSSGSQPFSAYHAPKGGNVGQQHTPTVKVSKGQTGNYNTLDFAGKSSGQKNDGDDSGGVYNHLNGGSDDPYNEVDREKRAEVIDDEYSHIK